MLGSLSLFLPNQQGESEHCSCHLPPITGIKQTDPAKNFVFPKKACLHIG